MNFVLDASAMVAYVEGEPGASVLAEILTDPEAVCYAHSINLCEVFYLALRYAGLSTARAALGVIDGDHVIERRDMSRDFCRRVGAHKARGGISLPDCFCITLAQELSAEVVTSDHGEFDPLVARGVAVIRFIR